MDPVSDLAIGAAFVEGAEALWGLVSTATGRAAITEAVGNVFGEELASFWANPTAYSAEAAATMLESDTAVGAGGVGYTVHTGVTSNTIGALITQFFMRAAPEVTRALGLENLQWWFFQAVTTLDFVAYYGGRYASTSFFRARYSERLAVALGRIFARAAQLSVRAAPGLIIGAALRRFGEGLHALTNAVTGNESTVDADDTFVTPERPTLPDVPLLPDHLQEMLDAFERATLTAERYGLVRQEAELYAAFLDRDYNEFMRVVDIISRLQTRYIAIRHHTQNPSLELLLFLEKEEYLEDLKMAPNMVIQKRRTIVHPFATPNGRHFHNSTGGGDKFQRAVLKANILTNPAENLYQGILVDGGGAAADEHDPLMTDQMKAVYDRYVVQKAKIRVDFFCNETGSQPQGFLVGVSLKDDAGTFSTLGQYMENEPGTTVWSPISPEGVCTLTLEVDVPKFFGLKDRLDSTLRGDASAPATPSNALYFHIFSQALLNDNIAGGNLAEINYACYVEYTTTWLEPKDVTRSA